MLTAFFRSRVFLLSASAGIVILGAVFFVHGYEDRLLAQAVTLCNAVPKESRFSCYRTALEKDARGAPLTLARRVEANGSISFGSNDSSYAIFGTNCHTFYHAVGDFVATHAAEAPPSSLISSCTGACTSGCMMGLYKRLALASGYATSTLGEFYKACPEESRHSCAHEIGHNLHDKYVTAILKTLDETSASQYHLTYPASYAYTTSPAVDLNAPFEDCKRVVPESELPYCYTGIGHNLFLFSEFSNEGYASAFKECDLADASNRDECYDFLVYRIGINDAAPKFLGGDAAAGNKVCNDIAALSGRAEVRRHCYVGVGGGIGLFLDSEYYHREFTSANLSLAQQDVLKKIALCELAEADVVTECYKGLLGTGAKKLYYRLNIHHIIIEEILPTISDDFQVVG